eukprot:gene2535-4943_t
MACQWKRLQNSVIVLNLIILVTANVSNIMDQHSLLLTNYKLHETNKGASLFLANTSTLWRGITASDTAQYLAAVVYEGGIFISSDYGSTWTSSDAPSNTWQCITSDSTGRYVSAGDVGGSIYTSSDYGVTWVASTSSLTDWSRSYGWISIASSSSGQYLFAASGFGYVYNSSDYGSTWEPTAFVNQISWNSICSDSSGQYLGLVSNGIVYTSSDYGNNWSEHYVGTERSGVTYLAITSDSSGRRLAVVDGGGRNRQSEVLSYNGGLIYLSSDYGVSWSQSNAPVAAWHSITSSGTGEYLAAAVYGGGIYVSSDFGSNWAQTDAISANWYSITSSVSGLLISGVVDGGDIYTKDLSSTSISIPSSTPTNNKNFYYSNGYAIYTDTNGEKISFPLERDSSSTGTGDWIQILSNRDGEVVLNYGQNAINNVFLSYGTGIFKYVISGYIYNFYKRISNKDFDLYSNLAQMWSDNNNILNEDFQMFSTYEDLINGNAPWQYCNYNDNGVGYLRDCGPNGPVYFKWTSFIPLPLYDSRQYNADIWLQVTDMRPIEFPTGEPTLLVSYLNYYYYNEPTGVPTQTSTTGQSWRSITASDTAQYLFAVVYEGGIFISSDYGSTWTSSDAPSNTWQCITSDSTGRYVSAGDVGGSIYTSSDYGVTWVASTSSLTDWSRSYGWISIASSSSGQYLFAASGFGYVYNSSDYGSTWEPTAFVNQISWNSICSDSSGQYLGLVSNGIVYTSSDYGNNWSEHYVGTERSGVTYLAITSDSSGRRLAVVDGGGRNRQSEVLSYNGGLIYLSSDYGVSWSQSNAPVAAWHSITSSGTGEYLAAAVYGGGIYVSSDFGSNWAQTDAISANWYSITSSVSGLLISGVVDGGDIYTLSVSFTTYPTRSPTAAPSRRPSSRPSAIPTRSPSLSPTISIIPTLTPIFSPTLIPVIPTVSPSVFSTSSPTTFPSTLPISSSPTMTPSRRPVASPTRRPSRVPSLKPVISPTLSPSVIPTLVGKTTRQPVPPTPTNIPSRVPTQTPTTFYSAYDSKNELYTTTKNIFFQYYANNINDLNSAQSKWNNFIINSLQISFVEVFYPAITVITSTVRSNDPSSTRKTFECINNETYSTMIVEAMINNQPIAVNCNGNNWYYDGQYLCINCNITTSKCPAFTPDASVFIPPTSCWKLSSPKISGAISITVERLVKETVPRIQAPITISSRSNSVEVQVLFKKESSGRVYCAATFNEVQIDNIRLIKSSDYYTEVVTDIYANITIQSLIPTTIYDVYCFTEDFSGNPTILSDVLQTGNTIQTQCCRSVLFTNNPSFVYGNLEEYNTADSSPSQYIFEYELAAAPDKFIIVTPILRYISNGKIASNIKITPPSNRFDSTVRADIIDLTGQFIISGAAGMYSLLLNITGENADVYIGDNATVQVLSSEKPPPAPQMTLVRFASSGSSAVVLFDSPTNTGNLKSDSFTCSSIFSFNGINSTSSCVWTNKSAASITIQYKVGKPVFSPGDRLFLLPKVITAYCSQLLCKGYEYSPSASLIAQYPLQPIAPVVIINAPSLIDKCTDLVIDATFSYGHGGRQWKAINFYVTATTAVNVTALQKYLDTIHDISIPLTIDNKLLYKADYLFRLNLINFLGKSSSQSVIVSVNFTSSTQRYDPQVSILGSPFRTITTSQTFSALATAILPSCASVTSLNYKWSIYKNYVFMNNIVSSSKDPKKIIIEPYTLNTFSEYQIVVNVTTNNNNGYGIAIIQVYIKEGNIFATIAGGTNRYVSNLLPVYLDASKSTDEDIRPNYPQSISFQWNCANFSSSGLGVNCESVFNGSMNKAQVSLYTDRLLPNINYIFFVTVSSGKRYQSASVVIKFIPENNAKVSIISSFTRFNPNNKLKLFSNITSSNSLIATWSLIGSSSISLSNPLVALTPHESEFTISNYIQNGDNSIQFPLCIASGIFPAGSSFTFRLTVRTSGSTGTSTSTDAVYSQVTLYTNAPPSSGNLKITPSKGIDYSTIFTFTANLWSADISQYPISYEFLFNRTSEGPALTIASPSESSFTTGKLSGAIGPDYIINCTLVVRDVYLASSTVYGSVTVIPNNNYNRSSTMNETALLHLSQSLLSYYNTMQYDKMMLEVNNLGSSLKSVNCTGTSNCSMVFNRKSCSDTSHTCGSCLDGYKGILGSFNGLCIKLSDQTRYSYSGSSTSDSYLINNDISISGDGIGSGLLNRCLYDSDCIYGTCSRNTSYCVIPEKSCPSLLLEKECSGHGSCVYMMSTTAEVVKSCLESNYSCIATCNCINGYGGNDCGLTSRFLTAVSAARSSMCVAITNVTAEQDPSNVLVMSMSSSLSEAFDPNQIHYNGTISACATALSSVMDMVAGGNLTGTNDGTINKLASLISSFADVRLQSPEFFTDDVRIAVQTAVASLQDGMHKDMVPGQNPIAAISDNILLFAWYISLTSLYSTSLSPPTGNIFENEPSPALILPAEGLNHCGFTENYALLSLMQWGTNVYSNSSNLNTKGFRITSSSTQLLIPSSTVRNGNYTIVLQYETKLTRSKTPACVLISEGKQEACPCSLKSYTSTNATFECYDISNLCPQSNNMFALPKNMNNKKINNNNNHNEYNNNQRRLDNINQITASGTGDLITRLVEYGGSVVQNTLQKKLTGQDFLNNIPVLIFVSMLIFFMSTSFIYFSIWDRKDRNIVVYVKNNGFYFATHKRKDYRHADTERQFSLSNLMRQSVDRTKSEVTLQQQLEQELEQEQKERQRQKQKQSSSSIIAITSFSSSEWDLTGMEMENNEKTLQNNVIRGMVKKFMQEIEPSKYFKWKSGWYRLVYALLARHKWTSMFAFKSLRVPRAIRFLQLCTDILSILFVNTIFYQIFYPDSEDNCPSADLTSTYQCERNTSVISGDSLCTWDYNTQYCSLRPPPTSFTYYSLAIFIVICFGIPIIIIFRLLLNQICAKRPRLEDIGLYTRRWLGSSSEPVHTARKSAFGMLLDKNSIALDLKESNESIQNYSKHYSYTDYLSIDEEVDKIIEDIKYSFRNELEHAPLPWQSDYISDKRIARIRAVMEGLGLYIDGTPRPLSWFDWIRYTSPRKKLYRKIQNARKRAENIIQILIRPQLQHIYKVLGSITVENVTDKGNILNDDIRVVQHLSAACRASRYLETLRLPSAVLLRGVNDLDSIDSCLDRRAKVDGAEFIYGWRKPLVSFRKTVKITMGKSLPMETISWRNMNLPHHMGHIGNRTSTSTSTNIKHHKSRLFRLKSSYFSDIDNSVTRGRWDEREEKEYELSDVSFVKFSTLFNTSGIGGSKNDKDMILKETTTSPSNGNGVSGNEIRLHPRTSHISHRSKSIKSLSNDWILKRLLQQENEEKYIEALIIFKHLDKNNLGYIINDYMDELGQLVWTRFYRSKSSNPPTFDELDEVIDLIILEIDPDNLDLRSIFRSNSNSNSNNKFAVNPTSSVSASPSTSASTRPVFMRSAESKVEFTSLYPEQIQQSDKLNPEVGEIQFTNPRLYNNSSAADVMMMIRSGSSAEMEMDDTTLSADIHSGGSNSSSGGTVSERILRNSFPRINIRTRRKSKP